MQERRSAFRKFGEGREVTSEGEKLLDDIRGHAWKQFAGRTEELAAIARLHSKTVEAFMWGDTRRPQFETVVRLLVALNLYHLIAGALGIAEPVSREMAAKLRS